MSKVSSMIMSALAMASTSEALRVGEGPKQCDGTSSEDCDGRGVCMVKEGEPGSNYCNYSFAPCKSNEDCDSIDQGICYLPVGAASGFCSGAEKIKASFVQTDYSGWACTVKEDGSYDESDCFYIANMDLFDHLLDDSEDQEPTMTAEEACPLKFNIAIGGLDQGEQVNGVPAVCCDLARTNGWVGKSLPSGRRLGTSKYNTLCGRGRTFM